MQEWGSERSEVEGTTEGIRMVRWGAVAVARGVVGGGWTRFVLDNPMRRRMRRWRSGSTMGEARRRTRGDGSST